MSPSVNTPNCVGFLTCELVMSIEVSPLRYIPYTALLITEFEIVTPLLGRVVDQSPNTAGVSLALAVTCRLSALNCYQNLLIHRHIHGTYRIPF